MMMMTTVGDTDDDYQATRLISGEEDVGSCGTNRLKIILWNIFNCP